MSGPKGSEYYLSPAERRRLEEERQRRLEEEKCRQLEASIELRKNQSRSNMQRIQQKVEQRVNDALKIVPETTLATSLQRICQQLQTHLENCPAAYSTSNSQGLSDYLAKLNDLCRFIESEENSINRYLDLLQEEMDTRQMSEAENDFLNQARSMEVQKRIFNLDAPVASSSDSRSDIHAPHQEDVEQVHVQETLYAFEDLLRIYTNNPLLEDQSEIRKLSRAVKKLMENDALDDQYKKDQIVMRMKAFQATCAKYDRLIENARGLCQEFESLHLTYLSLCEMLEQAPTSYIFTASTGIQTIAALKEDINRLQEQLTKKEEAQYIADSIDEVMKEMGYDIVATDFMSTPKRDVIHNIYEFEQGNVINVFTSDNGSLMFEVTGNKEINDLTELEKLKIKESMDSFCGKYAVIKNRLQARGIHFASEELKPADIRYARAIDVSKKKGGKTRSKRAAASKSASKKRSHLN